MITDQTSRCRRSGNLCLEPDTRVESKTPQRNICVACEAQGGISGAHDWRIPCVPLVNIVAIPYPGRIDPDGSRWVRLSLFA